MIFYIFFCGKVDITARKGSSKMKRKEGNRQSRGDKKFESYDDSI